MPVRPKLCCRARVRLPQGLRNQCRWIAALFAGSCFLLLPAAEAQMKSPERVAFGHTVSLVAHPGVPSLVSVVNTGDAPIAKVRALFVIDGQLLSLPLTYHMGSQSFRGRFPTPSRTASYQFQFTLRNGKAVLSESFQLPLVCGPEYEGTRSSPQDEFLRLQRKEEQLRYLSLALRRLVGGVQ